MRNLLFYISFCGTNYHGWQVQDNVLTVQQTVQEALLKLFGKQNDIKACSRTDAGVHAKEFCFSLKVESHINNEDIVKALNALLPLDIVVKKVVDAGADFHARYSVVFKEYEYVILNREIKNPFLDGLVWHYKYPLEILKLKLAASSFLGKHDFSSFCASNSGVKDKVRTIFKFGVEKKGEYVIFKVRGDGFLYNMVRIMVGTCVKVSSFEKPHLEIEKILKAKDRTKAFKTAPADGLYLSKVFY